MRLEVSCNEEFPSSGGEAWTLIHEVGGLVGGMVIRGISWYGARLPHHDFIILQLSPMQAGGGRVMLSMPVRSFRFSGHLCVRQ